MRFALSTLRKDLNRWRQDLGAIVLWLSVPLIIGTLITSMMGGGAAKPTGILLIADQDDSLVSGLVISAYSQGELGELISVEKVTVEAGTERIDAGEASGFLIIPQGFGNAFLESEAVTLVLKTNPAQTILPGIIRDVTEILLDAGFYLHEFFAPEIEILRGMMDDNESPDDLQVAAISVAINQKMETAGPHLFPPAIEIEVVEPPPTEAATYPFALLFVPGIILMALMFAANGLAHDFWKEREQGTLRRLVFAPGRMAEFLLGKALAAGIVILVICGAALLLGFLYHGVSLSRMPSALAWLGIAGMSLFAWFGFLQMLANTQRAANMITMMFLFPLLMAGGSFFPLAALPDWIAAIGRKTPNGFIADRLTMEIIADAAWAIDLQSWVIAIAMMAAGLIACGWRLRSGFARA